MHQCVIIMKRHHTFWAVNLYEDYDDVDDTNNDNDDDKDDESSLMMIMMMIMMRLSSRVWEEAPTKGVFLRLHLSDAPLLHPFQNTQRMMKMTMKMTTLNRILRALHAPTFILKKPFLGTLTSQSVFLTLSNDEILTFCYQNAILTYNLFHSWIMYVGLLSWVT